MKYRRLRNDELDELEKEFVTFLASNTVTGPEWESLKANEPEKAEKLIELFSDIVYDKILDKVEYLEYKTPKDLKTFHFESDRIVMLGVKVDEHAPVDFTRGDSPEQMSGQMIMSGNKMNMYRGEKAYRKDRKQEVFDLMESGALISKDGQLFKVLQELAGGS